MADSLSQKLSPFLSIIAEHAAQGTETLPSIQSLSASLGVSISSLREELQVARALGFVEVKPRTGIKSIPYQFAPAVSTSLTYGVRVDPSLFKQFSDLRNHVEASYWYQAVSSLTREDVEKLKHIVQSALQALTAESIIIPHAQHRELHLTIYSRLDNVFVLGILESYWEIYEAIGLNIYEDRRYLERVWAYHQQMVDSIAQGDFLSGYQALIAHMDLLFQRDLKKLNNTFE